MRFSLRPAGEKVAWPQAMTDEGDLRGCTRYRRAAGDSGPYEIYRNPA